MASLHVFFLITTFYVIHLVRAQDQQGFISLDCGLPRNESPYVEPETKLTFSSDADFISTGETGNIDKNLARTRLKPYTTLRYFPQGVRNCYNLNVTKNTNYLVRAMFRYGNYDGLNISPKFDLYIGPNLWETMDFQVADVINKEVIHIVRSNTLQICLVKTGETTPFISSLELRPLRNDTYITKSGSLKMFSRRFLSSSSDNLRYGDDVHDRLWSPFLRPEWTQINTTLDVSTSNIFGPPKAALKTAATPTSSGSPLTINFTLGNPDDQVYMFFHFSEIQASSSNNNGTREFDIMLNGASWYKTLTPRWLNTNTIYSTTASGCKEGSCSVQLVRTQRSTLPPLLNAYEIFTVLGFPQSETYQDDVTAVENIQTAYGLSRTGWQGDPCVPRQYAWEGLNCSYNDMSTPPRIISINFSSSGLVGNIALGIQNLTNLQVLDMSNNSLNGEVPEFLADMRSLLVLNLSGNNLSGLVPQALLDRQKNGLKLLVEGNPELCVYSSCGNGKNKFIVPIVASTASVAAVIVVVVVVIVFLKKKKASRALPHSSSVQITEYRPIDSPEPSFVRRKRRFTYSEVVAMTNSFKRVLGKGGFGFVYHGFVDGTEQVAVKMLSQSSSQGHRQFKAEVELLLRVHHINLVSLVGYCDEGDNLALIYEYMPNGDLRQHLSSGIRGGFVSSWASRLRIALDAALGLEYLHTGCKPPMLHRDVKTTNILLDEQFHAKLADFGLSRSFPVEGEAHESTVVAGTPGYLDPDYQRNGFTEKSDVYSFGIVLLELITNRPVIYQAHEKPYIAEWVGFMLTRGDIKEIVDPNLRGDYETGSVWKAVEVAMSCVNPSSTGRPNMSHVVQQLKDCLRSENLRTGGLREMEPKGCVEVHLEFTTDVFPKPR